MNYPASFLREERKRTKNKCKIMYSWRDNRNVKVSGAVLLTQNEYSGHCLRVGRRIGFHESKDSNRVARRSLFLPRSHTDQQPY
jgi:hypothetical protein